MTNPFNVLVEERLTSYRKTMGDGYMSVIIRTQEDAAQTALKALEDAGYKIVKAEE